MMLTTSTRCVNCSSTQMTEGCSCTSKTSGRSLKKHRRPPRIATSQVDCYGKWKSCVRRLLVGWLHEESWEERCNNAETLEAGYGGILSHCGSPWQTFPNPDTQAQHCMILWNPQFESLQLFPSASKSSLIQLHWVRRQAQNHQHQTRKVTATQLLWKL